jgi:peroxiredoxin family protein
VTVETTSATDTSSNGSDMHQQIDVQALMERIGTLEQRVAELESAPAQDIEDRLSMVVFSGDMDKVIASFIVATGAAAVGMEVSMFFTFWGLSAVKKQKRYVGKTMIEKGFTAMLPGGVKELGLSKMNYFGIGASIMRKLMRDHEVTSLAEMVEMAQEMDVRMIVCEMSRELLGVQEQELIDGLEFGGVAAFMGDASRSKVSLFI